MAKKRGKNKEAAEARPARAAAGPSSLLEAAYRAFEAGNMVGARAAATAALGQASTEREGEAARKLGPRLFEQGAEKADAAAVAREILARTRPPPRPYLFAVLSLAIFGMLLLVMRRG